MKKLPIILAGCFLFIACDRSIESRLKQQQTKETVRATGDIEDKSLLKPSMFKTAREVADEQRLAEELALEEENARRLEEERLRKQEEERLKQERERERARIMEARAAEERARAKAIEEKEKLAVEKAQKSTEKSTATMSSITQNVAETKKAKMLATVPTKKEKTKQEAAVVKATPKPSVTAVNASSNKAKQDLAKIEREKAEKEKAEKERIERAERLEKERVAKARENRRVAREGMSNEELRLGAQRPLSKDEIQFFKSQCRYAFMSEQDIIANRCQAKKVVRPG